jgi:hypothetical protein
MVLMLKIDDFFVEIVPLLLRQWRLFVKRMTTSNHNRQIWRCKLMPKQHHSIHVRAAKSVHSWPNTARDSRRYLRFTGLKSIQTAFTVFHRFRTVFRTVFSRFYGFLPARGSSKKIRPPSFAEEGTRIHQIFVEFYDILRRPIVYWLEADLFPIEFHREAIG